MGMKKFANTFAIHICAMEHASIKGNQTAEEDRQSARYSNYNMNKNETTISVRTATRTEIRSYLFAYTIGQYKCSLKYPPKLEKIVNFNTHCGSKWSKSYEKRSISFKHFSAQRLCI